MTVEKSSTATTWAGWALSTLVIVILVLDGATALFRPQTLAEPMAETAFPIGMIVVVGIAALASAILYAIPRSAVLGAILVTAFAGGAIATHVRIGQLSAPPQLFCLLLGMAAWGGLYLRDARLRALLPLRA